MSDEWKSIYRALKLDKQTRCPSGHTGVILLSALCATRLPAFYICHACGFVSEVGAGPVERRMLSEDDEP